MLKKMGMMPCEEAIARLWDFLDGELDAPDEAAVRKHLEFCSRCYPQYDFQRAYFEFTRRLREGERAPPDLRRRLFQRILVEDARGARDR
ncbi:MAG: zf-HC2 domain-containing protein [Gemmatimonadota bacterium]